MPSRWPGTADEKSATTGVSALAKNFRYIQTVQKDFIYFVSAAEFYDSIITNDLVACDDLPKLNLLYKAKPFDFNRSILSAIKSQPIEVLELVFNLAKHGNLNTLPLLENKLICTKGEIKQSSSKNGLQRALHTIY